ncbi:VOC family protein [Sphingorhabdus sp.]|jgi:predicted enzyme related to lactoylglutathione lyase|uniref:VOC family protein n=1 Tax=Sphingorhabdus sp. TaxID=1902408 RepID=UPI0037CBEBC4
MRGQRLAAACLLAMAVLGGCDVKEPRDNVIDQHPVFYFEIPVTNMNRAVTFYEELMELKLDRQIVDGYEMALFPFADGAPGATGALAKGDVYKPSKDGAIIYFQVRDIKSTVEKAQKLGRPILYPIKDVGEAGFVAEIEDTEGNRLALNQTRLDKE